MAALEFTRAQQTVGFVGRARLTFTSMIAAVGAWNDARITRRALSALSDRELEDIGLSRHDVDAL